MSLITVLSTGIKKIPSVAGNLKTKISNGLGLTPSNPLPIEKGVAPNYRQVEQKIFGNTLDTLSALTGPVGATMSVVTPIAMNRATEMDNSPLITQQKNDIAKFNKLNIGFDDEGNAFNTVTGDYIEDEDLPLLEREIPNANNTVISTENLPANYGFVNDDWYGDPAEVLPTVVAGDPIGDAIKQGEAQAATKKKAATKVTTGGGTGSRGIQITNDSDGNNWLALLSLLAGAYGGYRLLRK